MPTPLGSEIIELTDVVEEGHPDQPNLPPQSSSLPSDEALDDLDLEKEIDQIFADLGTSSSENASDDMEKSLGDDLNLDDLFGVSEASDREKPQAAPEYLAEQQEGTDETFGGEAPGDISEVPLSVESQVQIAPETDHLAPLLERLAAMEEKVARMDDSDQTVSEQIETRLSSMAEEFADKLRDQVESLRQELRADLERNIEQMVRVALAEVKAQHMEEFSHLLAVQSEDATARMEARIQELQDQNASAGQDVAETVAGRIEELRVGLLQELQEAIPAAAARIIREEIQALTQED